MQKPESVFPMFLTTDLSPEKMSENESQYIKGIQAGINANPDTGGNNPTGEGQNVLDLTPTRSNLAVPNTLLPLGYNKNCGSFYSDTTREFYYFNYNGNLNHGVYLLIGDSGQWYKIIEDPNLPFTDDQEAFLKDHRVSLRIVYDQDKNILEKFLVYTNGAAWQGWISVNAAIKTNGFDASLFPYWTLKQPHFDRRELIEWPMRPCMQNPVVSAIPNTPADLNKVNRIIDQAFQFSIRRNNTDGRPSTFSPFSLPLIVKSEDFLNSPDILPKNAILTLDAGSPMTESLDIFVRFTAKLQAGIPSTITWGDWQKYDRIYKFTGATGNPSDVLSTDYWLRTNPWSAYSYDPVFNTIQYLFDNSRLGDLVDQKDAEMLQNGIPLRSVALTALSDAAALSDNLFGYNNFPFGTIDNLDASVEEKTKASCPISNRKVRLYACAGRPSDNETWDSQVGYYVGQDTQVRWGSLQANIATTTPDAQFSVAESKEFNLDFADHDAFVCYAKGTPYYVVGDWYEVDISNNLTKLPSVFDFSDIDVLAGVQQAFTSGHYYICVFNFEIPAGKYDFCIGRHNVDLSADFRNSSTYVYGLANSRVRNTTYGGAGSFLTRSSVVTYSKEMEIDCSNADVDVWGNGKDVFFIYCPFITDRGNKKFRFIEGYLKESPDDQIGVELFPYNLNVGSDDWGHFTDRNGFYWAYTKRNNSDTANIEVTCKLNCIYPVSFEIPSNVPGSVLGPINNGFAYITDHNNGVVGDCNRVLYTGTITDITGTIPYSNISVSIANGATTLTATDGTFTLIIHNGQPTLRTDNIYVNAGGSFLITIANCGIIPLFSYNEANAPCFNCEPRPYPYHLNLEVLIQGGTQESVKEGGSYQVTIHAADLAGRLTFENVVATITVPSFLQRDDLLATYLRLLINGMLAFEPDLAWFAISVSDQVNVARYFQWVGDSIQYIDNQGNVVDDPATAVFCSIAIDSFYNYALSKNFSILASYQFTPDDRIKILDDGNGNLLDTATFGEPIDIPILGTNYNQAAQAAQIVPNGSTVPIVNNNINNTVNNTVNTSTTTPTTTQSFETQKNNISITLYVKYDSRLNTIINSNGFWIEIYTPKQEVQEIQYNELQWYPIIKGEVAEFTGINNGQPQFNFPSFIDIPFWDTYLFYRTISIPNVGDKFLNHPFESPNISDSFGANVSSGGRKWEKDDDATQQWLVAHTIKSDAYVGNGIINGMGTFRSENSKNFIQYPFGAILATITQRSIVFFLCENDWFTTSFDFHFTYPNEHGIMVVNLDNNLSTPHQKIGSNFGLSPDDTGSVIVFNKHIYWYDSKNEAWVMCDYQSAEDVSDILEKRGEEIFHVGIKSYFIKKTQFIRNWNNSHGNNDRFDVIAGIDPVRKNIYITFRPRRNNSNDLRSYINKRRNLSMSQQETMVFNIDSRRWTRSESFTPEGYGNIKGNTTGVEMISLAAGKPYYHNNTGNQSFLNFYGIQTEPVFMCVFNQSRDIVKILQSISMDSTKRFYADLIYTSQYNAFSYLPSNYFKNKEGTYYAAVLRNMNSYPPIDPGQLFRSMLIDGGRISDVYMILRFILEPKDLGQYFQINDIFYLVTNSKPIKK